MSHVKASGKVAQNSQRTRRGKRLGLKKSGGQLVKVGQIIVKQKGAKYKLGHNTAMGRDYTIFAMRDGRVEYGTRHQKTIVSVI